MTFVDESRQPADHDLRQVAPKGIKLWCRRMGSLMAMSGLLYVTVALGLRFIGDGNDSGFFVPKEIDAEVYYFTNTALGDRFPSAVSAFAPNRQRFQAAKSEDTYRIFLFGESAAMGYPEPAYGVGPQLERLLDARYPGTDFEVICVTSATSDSEDILPHARDAAKLNGDAWVVYMGNNEQVALM